MSGAKTLLGGTLALLLLSQTGCIVGAIVSRFVDDEAEDCESGRWGFEGGQTFDTKEACVEQTPDTQACVCQPDVGARFSET